VQEHVAHGESLLTFWHLAVLVQCKFYVMTRELPHDSELFLRVHEVGRPAQEVRMASLSHSGVH
jgi:hypothetical protein